MWTLEESIDSYLGGVEGVPWHPSPNGKKYRSSDHQKGKTRQERWSLVESWTQGMTIYENSDVECGIILRSSMNIQNLKMRSRCSSSSSGSLKLIPELEIERYQRKMALTKDLFDQLVEESCEGPDSYVLRTISQMNLSPRQQTLQGCKCTKIDCLKMYCECFSKGRVCNQKCECFNCCNKEDCQLHIYKAQQLANFRHPGTFKGVPAFVPERRCTCKKSQCRKNYCQCYRAGVKCTEECECLMCQNGKPHTHEDFFDSRMQIEVNA